jgi:hypothetical protein
MNASWDSGYVSALILTSELDRGGRHEIPAALSLKKTAPSIPTEYGTGES